VNFYKILNKEEVYFGVKYHDGLNEDPRPFNPSGDCEPGGIYFAREDILAFLSYGPWIRQLDKSLYPRVNQYMKIRDLLKSGKQKGLF